MIRQMFWMGVRIEWMCGELWREEKENPELQLENWTQKLRSMLLSGTGNSGPSGHWWSFIVARQPLLRAVIKLFQWTLTNVVRGGVVEQFFKNIIMIQLLKSILIIKDNIITTMSFLRIFVKPVNNLVSKDSPVYLPSPFSVCAFPLICTDMPPDVS